MLDVSVTVFTAAAELAIDAVPVKFAVIVPAEKLPEPSLNTKVETVFAEVPLEYTIKSVPSPAVPPRVMPLPETATDCA